MSDEAVQAAVDYTDNMDTLQRTFGGLKNSIMGDILPGFNDILLGLTGCAFADRSLSSEISFKGICRKVLIFALVGIANLIDVFILQEVGVLRTAVIFFYLSNEGVSILENSSHLGLPIPEKLKSVLSQLHNREVK